MSINPEPEPPSSGKEPSAVKTPEDCYPEDVRDIYGHSVTPETFKGHPSPTDIILERYFKKDHQTSSNQPADHSP